MAESDHSGNTKRRVSITLKIWIGILAATALALGPHSAFAQHGRGGHGGGGGGSHGGGGGHASGGSHGGVSTGSRGSASGGSAQGSAAGSSHLTGGQAFVGGNMSWRGPLNSRTGVAAFVPTGNASASEARNSATALGRGIAVSEGSNLPIGVHNGVASFSVGMNSTRQGTLLGSRVFPLPPRIFVPRGSRGFNGFLFFGGGCFNGFFPGFCGSSFWWGPAWAWGPSCDPEWGCNGFGYLNYDWGGGDDSQPLGDDVRSQESGPFSLRAWPRDDSGRDGALGESGEMRMDVSKPTVTIYLRDGSSYGVTDYWLADGNLHYVTTYGGENNVPVEQLDLQHTVDENAARGVNFTLTTNRRGSDSGSTARAVGENL